MTAVTATHAGLSVTAVSEAHSGLSVTAVTEADFGLSVTVVIATGAALSVTAVTAAHAAVFVTASESAQSESAVSSAGKTWSALPVTGHHTANAPSGFPLTHAQAGAHFAWESADPAPRHSELLLKTADLEPDWLQ